jgi:hypothetical protein
MKDFWWIFNQECSANIRTRAGSPSSSGSTSANQGAKTSTGAAHANNENSQGADDDDDGSREEGNQEPNRSRNGNRSKETRTQVKKFACPYRKYNPRKYCYLNRTWRTCALASFDTVARVKYALDLSVATDLNL